MKKLLAIFLILIMVFSLVACTSENPKKDGDIVDQDKDSDIVNEDDEDTDEEDKVDIVDPTPKTDEEEIILYFSNKEYIETGNENLDKVLPEKRTIEYGDISLEEAVVRELMKGPESDKLSTSIPSTVKLLGVEVSNGMAFVNFSQEGLFGGSLQEDLTISQIVNSLLELDSVDKVQFLVDGEKTESLMGHFDTTEPFDSMQD